MNLDPDSQAAQGLGAYVAAVAHALTVPRHAVSFEIAEYASAYLALAVRSGNFPDRDLMLVWDEHHGWSVGVETDPGDPPVVLSYLSGDLLPEPSQVRAFVDEVVAGSYPGELHPPRFSGAELPGRLARYAGESIV
ncbi:DUF6292 family protein [Kutzneria viridogrisea]|uniref:DUF6292 family protein n=1 Tax=Kutzneria viridogrisea TaxID=47990 RepID=UPI00296F6FF8